MAKRKKRQMKKAKIQEMPKKDNSGLWVPAGALLGVGIGLLYGRPDVGVLVGLGIGFILMDLTKLLKK